MKNNYSLANTSRRGARKQRRQRKAVKQPIEQLYRELLRLRAEVLAVEAGREIR